MWKGLSAAIERLEWPVPGGYTHSQKKKNNQTNQANKQTTL
jgi:hypothetical protein